MASNFIRDIIDEDLRSGRHTGVVTRFPPEPNGYLHIGHAKSICLNFGLARDYGGACHLRMDDTNPETEEQHFVDVIQRDVRWLGFDWGDAFFHAADYFDRFYEAALHLVRAGKAYVDHLSVDEIRAYRGTLSEPGRPSPHRDRGVAENLELLRRMRAGDLPDGACVLRARIDLTSPNMKMRDPLLYRIRHTPHHRTGDRWPIYPMYDFAHPLSDAYEQITHSICTLEFENNRELYDWVVDNCPVPARPRQYEFARLQIGYTVLSKRKLARLVAEGHVSGWDDPRMPTIAGLRRRGYTPESIRNFCEMIGVAKTNSTVDIGKLEFAIRDDLNLRAPRVMCVLRPLRVTLLNLPADETLDAPYFPPEIAREGSRPVPLTREIYIERDDFAEVPPKGFHRLSPGGEVRLRHAYVIRCEEVVKDAAGHVVELRCTADLEAPAGGRRVKGTIHWVSATAGVPVEVRLYDRLFTAEKPDLADDFLALLNPESLVVLRGVAEPALGDQPPGSTFQFERQGYFHADPAEHRADMPVFNRVVALRDSWAKATDAPAAVSAEPRAPRAKGDTRPPKKTAAELRARARSESPMLEGRFSRYTGVFGLSEELADVLTGDKALSDFFEAALLGHGDPRVVANWTANELLGLIEGRSASELPFQGAALGRLIALVEAGTISGVAAKEVLAELVAQGGDPAEIVERRGLRQVGDDDALLPIIDAVVAENPGHVDRYRAGNAGLLGFFVGHVMRRSGGKADPRKVNDLLRARLG